MGEEEAVKVNDGGGLLLERIDHDLKHADSDQSLRAPVQERQLKRTQTLETLVEYNNQFPQVRDGKVMYVIVKGFARELLIQAKELTAFNPAIPVKTSMRVDFGPRFVETHHGDIDVVHLDKKQLRVLWENWRSLLESGIDIDNDSSVRTFAASLLEISDFTKPQLHQGKLDQYYCYARVAQGVFVVPRPEVMLLEYTDFPSGRLAFQKGFVSDLMGKYQMDVGLVEELLEKNKLYLEKTHGVK